METSTLSIDDFKTRAKLASLLWLEGFGESCCLHRVVAYCRRSRDLSIRTGQNFLLNGIIFLGSIFILRSLVIPTLNWILPDQCPQIYSQEPCLFWGALKLYSFIRLGLVQLVYLLWFYPLYLFSYILSTIWYNDIAKYGFLAVGEDGSTARSPSYQKDSFVSPTQMDNKSIDLGGVMIGIAEQAYSVLLLSFFFLTVFITGFIPYVGKTLNFLLLSWMYAYYCFEYKWNLSGLSLSKRLDFFETNWAFFAGFGSPCVLAIFFFSPLVSYGVMAILYPLFVLTATGSDADNIIASRRRRWEDAELGRLHIFYAADYLSMQVLSLIFSRRSKNEVDNKEL